MPLLPTDPYLATGKQWNLGAGKAGINAVGAWTFGYTGAGIRVAVIDNGFNLDNADLAHFDRAASYDAYAGGSDIYAASSHGTAVANVLGAAADGTGMVGVAYDTTMVGVKLTFGAGMAQYYRALDHAWNTADITSMSWTFGAWGDRGLLDSNLYQGTAFARNGYGEIWVVGAGNERAAGDNINLHAFQSSQYVMAVGSTDINGRVSAFSTPGVALHVVAPAETIVTSWDTAIGTGTGTSFAAPTVSGVAALMLQANRYLSWRAVQDIIGLTAHKTDAADANYLINHARDWNGGGMHHSADYGFGLVDAGAAVRLAEAYVSSYWGNPYPGISRSVGATLKADFADTAIFSGMRVEKAMLTISLGSNDWGDYRISLVSAQGTESVLIDHALVNASTGTVWTFTSEQFWGEDAAGGWTVKIHDHDTADTTVLKSWSLRLSGENYGPDTQYVFTDELSAMLKADPARGIIKDAGTGYDTLNFSAVSGKLAFSLALGGTLTNADGSVASLSISGGTAIENLFGGAGDDSLSGTSANNVIRGGYGNDTMSGSGGNDIFVEGRNSGRDVIMDFSAGDKVWLTDGVGLSAISGKIAYLSDGSMVLSGSGYLWKATDFTQVSDWLHKLPHSDSPFA